MFCRYLKSCLFCSTNVLMIFVVIFIFFALVQFKIEEITQKLRTGELGIPVDPTARFVNDEEAAPAQLRS